MNPNILYTVIGFNENSKDLLLRETWLQLYILSYWLMVRRGEKIPNLPRYCVRNVIEFWRMKVRVHILKRLCTFMRINMSSIGGDAAVFRTSKQRWPACCLLPSQCPLLSSCWATSLFNQLWIWVALCPKDIMQMSPLFFVGAAPGGRAWCMLVVWWFAILQWLWGCYVRLYLYWPEPLFKQSRRVEKFELFYFWPRSTQCLPWCLWPVGGNFNAIYKKWWLAEEIPQSVKNN